MEQEPPYDAPRYPPGLKHIFAALFVGVLVMFKLDTLAAILGGLYVVSVAGNAFGARRRRICMSRPYRDQPGTGYRGD